MHTCEFCGEIYSLEDLLELDKSPKGFWCDDCDGFTYFQSNRQDSQNYILILEKKGPNVTPLVKGPRFNKRLSPLRYPGGKSKFIDYAYSKINQNQSKQIVGAFAGGASLELSLLEKGIFESLVLNDADPGVYSLFKMIKTHPSDLINLITRSKPTHADFFYQRELIKNDYNGLSELEAAWALLLTNRLAYSGIYKANPLGGRTGSNAALLARWNPDDLIKRITKIHQMSSRITVLNDNANEVIEEYYWHPETTIFIDPPYYVKGKDLYHHFFTEDDHIQLNVLLETLYQGCPGADLLITYDDHPDLEKLYWLPEIEKAGRSYSI